MLSENTAGDTVHQLASATVTTRVNKMNQPVVRQWCLTGEAPALGTSAEVAPPQLGEVQPPPANWSPLASTPWDTNRKASISTWLSMPVFLTSRCLPLTK